MTANLCSTLESATASRCPPQISTHYKQRSPEDIRVKPLRAGGVSVSLSGIVAAGRCARRRKSDRDRLPVEGGDFEPLEFLPRVVVALVTQDAKRRRLP